MITLESCATCLLKLGLMTPICQTRTHCSPISGSLALEALLIGVQFKKRYINV